MASDDKPMRFGEPVVMIYASEDNPIRRGFFVRRGTRKSRLNSGAFVQITDGKGRFWECKPDAVARAEEAGDGE